MCVFRLYRWIPTVFASSLVRARMDLPWSLQRARTPRTESLPLSSAQVGGRLSKLPGVPDSLSESGLLRSGGVLDSSRELVQALSESVLLRFKWADVFEPPQELLSTLGSIVPFSISSSLLESFLPSDVTVACGSPVAPVSAAASSSSPPSPPLLPVRVASRSPDAFCTVRLSSGPMLDAFASGGSAGAACTKLAAGRGEAKTLRRHSRASRVGRPRAAARYSTRRSAMPRAGSAQKRRRLPAHLPGSSLNQTALL